MVTCLISLSVVGYSYVRVNGLITSGEEDESCFFCYRLLVIMEFLFGEVSSWCLGQALFFFVGTPRGFHMIIIFI